MPLLVLPLVSPPCLLCGRSAPALPGERSSVVFCWSGPSVVYASGGVDRSSVGPWHFCFSAPETTEASRCTILAPGPQSTKRYPTQTCRSWKFFLAAMVPFLGFNAWGLCTDQGRSLFTKLMWIDVVGNLVWYAYV